MKKNLMKLLALGLVMGIFVGCSSDDDDTTSADALTTPTETTTEPTTEPTGEPEVASTVTAENVLPF